MLSKSSKGSQQVAEPRDAVNFLPIRLIKKCFAYLNFDFVCLTYDLVSGITVKRGGKKGTQWPEGHDSPVGRSDIRYLRSGSQIKQM